MTEKRVALFSIGEVGEILGSHVEGDLGFHRASVYDISTDSRSAKDGDLFVAINGESYNGHDFLDSAFDRGAAAAVISRHEALSRELRGPRYIAVDDTLFALGELAMHYRRRMHARIVAVTGSNGKTTVKNLIYEILCRKGLAVKSQGNFNNLIGLPTSIFRLRREHKNAVFELGMSARGEIDRLAEIAQPDFALITNVGPVHLEFLRNIDEVAQAKLEIVEHIKPGGILILNGDDVILNNKLGKVAYKQIRFGLGENNDLRPKDLTFDMNQMPHFRLGSHTFNSPMPGIHNVYNVLAACAVAKAMGISIGIAADAINTFKPNGMRSELVRKNDVTLLIDCYNANPVSTKMALDTFAAMECKGARIAVLADMLELGEKGPEFHTEIGAYARQLKIDNIFAYGPLSRKIAESFGDGAFHYENKNDLIESLKDFISAGDIILFKGSRGMALEEVADAVKKTLENVI